MNKHLNVLYKYLTPYCHDGDQNENVILLYETFKDNLKITHLQPYL